MAADAVLDERAEQEARLAEPACVEAALDVLGVPGERPAQVGEARVLAAAVALELLRALAQGAERGVERGPVGRVLEARGGEGERERHAQRRHDLRHRAPGRPGFARRAAGCERREPGAGPGDQCGRAGGRETDPSHASSPRARG